MQGPISFPGLWSGGRSGPQLAVLSLEVWSTPSGLRLLVDRVCSRLVSLKAETLDLSLQPSLRWKLLCGSKMRKNFQLKVSSHEALLLFAGHILQLYVQQAAAAERASVISEPPLSSRPLRGTSRNTPTDKISSNGILSAGTLTSFSAAVEAGQVPGGDPEAGQVDQLSPRLLCLPAVTAGSYGWTGQLFHGHFSLTPLNLAWGEGICCVQSLPVWGGVVVNLETCLTLLCSDVT